jgi:hypothetical protein
MENNPQNFMTMTSVYDFHNLMLTNKLIMIYDGEFNQDITKTVLAMTEKTFDADGVDEAVKKKVFNVMVESLQNICKHQYHASLENTTSIFMIGDDDKDFMVISGNPIVNENIDNVKGKIDHVNTLDKEGLKAFYKESRLKSTISNVGGAGLGFIDMARKSGKRLEYSFEKINDSLSFFTLLIRVSKIEIAE